MLGCVVYFAELRFLNVTVTRYIRCVLTVMIRSQTVSLQGP
jgi:hypothetical protein